jgi:hypothetical protein
MFWPSGGVDRGEVLDVFVVEGVEAGRDAAEALCFVGQAILQEAIRHLAVDVEPLALAATLPTQERESITGAHAQRDPEH